MLTNLALSFCYLWSSMGIAIKRKGILLGLFTPGPSNENRIRRKILLAQSTRRKTLVLNSLEILILILVCDSTDLSCDNIGFSVLFFALMV